MADKIPLWKQRNTLKPGVKPIRGEPLKFRSIGLTSSQWEYLMRWTNIDNPTDAIQNLLAEVQYLLDGPRTRAAQPRDAKGRYTKPEA